MRRMSLVAFLACQLMSAAAFADAEDFQLYKLGNPASNPDANANFRLMAMQLAGAISSYNMAPPETLGHSGFNIAFEYAVALIDVSPTLWPTQQDGPPHQLLMPTIHVRKGLPFSFELGAKVTYLQSTRMAAGTIELKWALNEGFIYFPQLGIRGHGTHIVGGRDLNLTTAGVDVGIGHQFAIGGMCTLTPYGGVDFQFTSATSGVIDFRPDRSLPDALTDPTTDTNVFESVTMLNSMNLRGYFGLRLISYVFELGVEGSYVKTCGDLSDCKGVKMSDGTFVAKQLYVLAVKVGLDF